MPRLTHWLNYETRRNRFAEIKRRANLRDTRCIVDHCQRTAVIGLECARHGARQKVVNTFKDELTTNAAKERAKSLAAYLYRRFCAVSHGEPSLTPEERIEEAFAVRRHYKITWGGPEGLLTVAELIKWMDTIAMKSRKHAAQ